MKPFELVRPQLGRDTCRQVGRDAGLQFTGPSLNLFDLLLGEEFFGRIIGELQCVQALRFGGQFARTESKPRQPFVFVFTQVVSQPAPALAFETHVAAFGVEQQLDFLLR